MDENTILIILLTNYWYYTHASKIKGLKKKSFFRGQRGPTSCARTLSLVDAETQVHAEIECNRYVCQLAYPNSKLIKIINTVIDASFQDYQSTDSTKRYVMSPKIVPFDGTLAVPDGRNRKQIGKV